MVEDKLLLWVVELRETLFYNQMYLYGNPSDYSVNSLFSFL